MGNLPSGWKETTLGEVAEIKGGKRLPKGEVLILEKTSHPYIRITDIENNSIKKQQLQFITEDIFKKISRYIVNEGDIVLSIVGTIGLVAKIDQELENANLTENCVKLTKLKELHNFYLYYYLISRNGQYEINKNTVGAVQKKLPIYGVQNIKISLPPLPEQKAIADVLSSLDEKIELLQEENKTLEELAQTIFKEWFVNFNFPGATGEIEKSELGEFPKGWRVGKLGEEFDLSIGRTPPRKEQECFSEKPIGLKWASIKDMVNSGVYIFNTSEYITDDAISKYNVPIIPENTLLLSFKMTVGKLAITTEKMLSNEAIAHLKIIKDSKIFTEYLYLFLHNLDFNALGSTSSIVTAVNSKIIKEIPFIVPDDITACNFYEIIKPVFAKLKNNSEQIQTLSKIKDNLLSKLLSGEIRVEGFGE